MLDLASVISLDDLRAFSTSLYSLLITSVFFVS